MPLAIILSDITKLRVDAVVNAANTDLRMGGGVCGAIFRAAGARELQAACDKLAPIRTGEAVITPGFNLPAKYVIHAAGPIYDRRDAVRSEQYLRAAYTNALKRAVENNCASIAFPLISSGIYGYPKADALRTAIAAIRDFIETQDIDVILAVFDQETLAAGEKLRRK
jgi:O-acetyl-ADP-ribose deacetylase (regulator of RNase III)